MSGVSIATGVSALDVLNPSTAAAVVGASGFRIDNSVAAPASNLAAAAGAAGLLTGTYYYATAYLLNDGTITEPWPGTAVSVALSAQQANLTNIPVSDSPLVVGRLIYRTKAASADPKDYYLAATIPDNTTTTYTDNVPDASLGAPANWVGTAAGTITNQAGRVAGGLSTAQSLAIGAGSNAGYASVSIGYQAGENVTTGRRNVSVGVYAGESTTTGYQNTFIGVHAGGGNVTGYSNTMIGYGAGSATRPMNQQNTAVGDSALVGTGANIGIGNVALGFRALADINTADYCIGIGYAAGKYANLSRQVFIDGADRGSISNAQNIGLIYGRHESTAIAQVLHINALTRIGPPSVTVATLPAAAAGLTGYRAFVTDANATTFASIVAGGGSNGVPVYCDGTNWRIG